MTGEKLLDFYKQMLLMRRFEEEANRCYKEGNIGGFCHLYIGQEAVATGTIGALKPQDKVITAYRDHCHFIAKGGSPKAAMAELFGKVTGCSKGRGGSMHFFSKEHNFYGGHGIVGAHIPIGTGLAFASKYKKDDSVAVCFFGEGATSIGPFHEGLCLAALWKLPIVFVIENNGYAMGTPVSRQMILEDVSMRALAYPMVRDTVEGYDVEECFDRAKVAIDRAREGGGPTLLEFKTYRYRGHSIADPQNYRTKAEVEKYKKEKDPLKIVLKKLEDNHSELFLKVKDIKKEIEQEVSEAIEFAENSPFPDLSTVEDYTII